MIPSQRIRPVEVLLAIDRLERLPIGRIGGHWTRTVRRWRQRLAAEGIGQVEAEAEIALAYSVVWKQCLWARRRLPRPEIVRIQRTRGLV